MILVDSSVLIDQFAGRTTLQTLAFEALLMDQQQVAIGDLMLVEVLQGTRGARHFDTLRVRMSLFPQVAIVSPAIAVEAARRYRRLRALGITIRKTIDTLIATRCILDGIPLLYADRDFDPFVEHLGLRSALDLPGVT